MDTDGINLKKMPTTLSVKNIEEVSSIAAVIELHNELPRNEKGVATFTIRQLLDKFVPGLKGLLREYVCAFGVHGLTVMVRYVYMEHGNNDDVVREYKELVAQKLSKFRGQL